MRKLKKLSVIVQVGRKKSKSENKKPLACTTLWADKANDRLLIIFVFLLENRLTCHETICMKFQSLFSGKNKNISKCNLLKLYLAY